MLIARVGEGVGGAKAAGIRLHKLDEFDPLALRPQRVALLRAQEIVWDECPWIWLLEQPDINAINRRLKWTAGRRDEYLLFHEATLGA